VHEICSVEREIGDNNGWGKKEAKGKVKILREWKMMGENAHYV